MTEGEVNFRKESTDSLLQLDQSIDTKLDMDFSETDFTIEENDYEKPMAMIVEDDYLCQMCVQQELKKMNFLYVTASTVNDARDIYLTLETDFFNIIFLILSFLLLLEVVVNIFSFVEEEIY